VVGLDKETFDHDVTDFELKGSHQSTQCEACHEPDLQYRDAPSQCIDCHKEDDNHKGRLGEVCGDCHVESAWRDAKFDHDETDFPLEGNHKDTSCNGCHANERYEDTPTECYACHRLDDVHRGSRGQECNNCHSPRDWDAVLFDHSRDTDFPLEGQHNDVACDSCHEGGVFEKEMDTACFACHRSDDDHQGRNGEECDNCHSPQAWAEVSFDLYPNPAQEQTSLRIEAMQNQRAVLQIINGHGKVVLERVLNLSAGNNIVSLSLPGAWPSGFYVAAIVANGRIGRRPFIKL